MVMMAPKKGWPSFPYFVFDMCDFDSVSTQVLFDNLNPPKEREEDQ